MLKEKVSNFLLILDLFKEKSKKDNEKHLEMRIDQL
jgi:hypothetical protein